MFSLIITIISVALTAALALATLYYGGNAYSQARADAQATKVKNQAAQLLAASEFFKVNNGRYPLNVAEMVAEGYLRSEPVARAAVAVALANQAWYMPLPGESLFLLPTSSSSTCSKVNERGYGAFGILPGVLSSVQTQCFGTSLSALYTMAAKDPRTVQVLTSSDGSAVVGPAPVPVLLAAVPSHLDESAWLVAPSQPVAGVPPEDGGGTGPGPDPENPGGPTDPEEPGDPDEGTDPPDENPPPEEPPEEEEPPLVPFSVSSISPSALQSGANLSLSVTGAGFRSPLTASIAGIDRNLSINQDATSASGNFVGGIPFGTWPIYLTNADEPTVQAGTVRALVTLSASTGFSTGGYSLTLSGSGFDGSTKVFFGANEATVTAATATQLTVTVPAGTQNTSVDVRVQRGTTAQATDLVLTSAFAYQMPDVTEGTVSTLAAYGRSVAYNGVAFAGGELFFSPLGDNGLWAMPASSGATAARRVSFTSSGFNVASGDGARLYFGADSFTVRTCQASSCAASTVSYSGVLNPSGASTITLNLYRVSSDGAMLYGMNGNQARVRSLNPSTGAPTATVSARRTLTSDVPSGFNARDMAVLANGQVQVLMTNGTTLGQVLTYSADLQTLLGTREFSFPSSAGTNVSWARTATGEYFIGANNAIYRLGTSGNPELYAGVPGSSGSTDGVGGAARIGAIRGMEMVGSQLYVYEQYAVRIVD